MMDEKEFRNIVENALDDVPVKFAERLKNVAMLIEDAPDIEDLHEHGIAPGEGTLLGLYRGIPHTERGTEYGVGMTLPDTITLFRLPILEAAVDEGKEIADVVRETVWHEIAHYFGMDEHGVNLREDKGTNRYK